MLGVSFLTGGCATHALWGVKDCKPSTNGNLSIAYTPEKHDFLVKYDELTNAKSPETISYLLLAYSDNPPKNHRPVFVQETELPELTTIPILKENDPVPETGYSAMYCPLQGTFDLYHEGVDIGRFTLPNYSTPAEKATVTRVMLTPPAVIADTVAGTVAGAVEVIAVIIVAGQNGNFSNLSWR